MIEIYPDEVLRYLGYQGAPADGIVLQQIINATKELTNTMSPRSVTRKAAFHFPKKDTVEIDGVSFKSNQLFQHLNGCHSGVLFAATLGAPVDLLIQRYTVVDMSYAVILQACAAAAIESYCDECQAEIAAQAAKDGFFLRPRYSPGYGDFPLSYQKELLSLLNCQRRIGLTCTESNMLVPTKSVTAVIGFTKEKTGCHIAKCMFCNTKNCPFRKEDYDG